MADRNLAFATTQPDSDRRSYVRVTAGRRPVSMTLAIDATLVRQLADDLVCGAVNAERVPDVLRMLADRLEKLEASASALEDVANAQMGKAV